MKRSWNPTIRALVDAPTQEESSLWFPPILPFVLSGPPAYWTGPPNWTGPSPQIACLAGRSSLETTSYTHTLRSHFTIDSAQGHQADNPDQPSHMPCPSPPWNINTETKRAVISEAPREYCRGWRKGRYQETVRNAVTEPLRLPWIIHPQTSCDTERTPHVH